MDLTELLGAVLGALAINALFNELLEWQPRFRNWCLRLIVRRLPEAERELRMEEWAAHMNECPGTFSKLLLLLSFWWAGRGIARDVEGNLTARVEQQPQSEPTVEDIYDIDFVGPENMDRSEVVAALRHLRNKLVHLRGKSAGALSYTVSVSDRVYEVLKVHQEVAALKRLLKELGASEKGDQDAPPT